MMSDNYNYNDLLKQFKMIKRMGSMSKIMGFIPGMGKYKEQMSNVDDKQFDKMSVLIHSMTEEERKNPKLVDSSSRRRQRISKGSGMQVSDLNRLIQSLDQQKKMVKQMSGMSEHDMKKYSKKSSQLDASNKGKKR